MHQKIWIAALALLLVIAWSTAPQSSETDSASTDTQLVPVGTDTDAPTKVIKGSEKKGKYYFKKSCKSCHGKKGDGGKLTPISKTIRQWERFFKKGVHFEAQPIDSLGTAVELLHIKTFVVAHAADSDQPETCK